MFKVSKGGSGKFIDSLRLTVRGGPGGMGLPKYGLSSNSIIEVLIVVMFILNCEGGVGGKGGNVILVAQEGKAFNHLKEKI